MYLEITIAPRFLDKAVTTNQKHKIPAMKKSSERMIFVFSVVSNVDTGQRCFPVSIDIDNWKNWAICMKMEWLFNYLTPLRETAQSRNGVHFGRFTTIACLQMIRMSGYRIMKKEKNASHDWTFKPSLYIPLFILNHPWRYFKKTECWPIHYFPLIFLYHVLLFWIHMLPHQIRCVLDDEHCCVFLHRLPVFSSVTPLVLFFWKDRVFLRKLLKMVVV